MALRDQFNQERDLRVSQRLTELARNFDREVRRRVDKNPRDLSLYFTIDEINTSDFRNTPGYKALHDAAHAADLKIEVQNYSDRVTVTINKPYRESPDSARFYPPPPPPPVTPAKPGPAPKEAPPSGLEIVREKAKDSPKPKPGPSKP